MRIEITKQDCTMVFEVAEESGIAVFDKIRKVFSIITMNGESFPSGIDFFKKQLEVHDAAVERVSGVAEPLGPQDPYTQVFGVDIRTTKQMIDDLRKANKSERYNYPQLLARVIEILERFDSEMPRVFSMPYVGPYVPPSLPYWPNLPNTNIPQTGDPLPPGGITICSGDTSKDSYKIQCINRTEGAMCQADGATGEDIPF